MKPFDKKKIMEIKDDIFISFIILTIIPFLGNRKNKNYKKLDFTRAQWAFPLVGIFLGYKSFIIPRFKFVNFINFCCYFKYFFTWFDAK